jgi:uncharacterized membrane protein|tara:strand:- start:190 stop:378 length:189 start_codon:yes stop_codon:yes gene_type:complete
MKKFFLIFLILIFHSLVLANDNQDLKVSTSIDNQLKTLQDLYKSGVLSGYEYEKEKKKILNN